MAAVWTLAAGAQTTASAVRAGVDARSMAPSPAAANEAAPPASGLTRDQRKEAALQARQSSTLKPAGEAAEYRDGAAAARRSPPVAAAAAPAAVAAPVAVATPARPAVRATRPRSGTKTVTAKKPRQRQPASAASAPR